MTVRLDAAVSDQCVGTEDSQGQTPSPNQHMQLQIAVAPWRIEKKRLRLMPNDFGYLFCCWTGVSLPLIVGVAGGVIAALALAVAVTPRVFFASPSSAAAAPAVEAPAATSARTDVQVFFHTPARYPRRAVQRSRRPRMLP